MMRRRGGGNRDHDTYSYGKANMPVGQAEEQHHVLRTFEMGIFVCALCACVFVCVGHAYVFASVALCLLPLGSSLLSLV